MNEDVRLVVWDLDETFWSGTLTEGGISAFIERHHQLVVALAKRGVVSSICSKNDFNRVKDILSQQGLWDYFVFPSIDWSPKAPRLRGLIDDVQLRPQTVLFIDDNPSNLAEAAALVPGLQVAGPDRIETLCEEVDALGKDDGSLSRLNQYKLLERKSRDRAGADVDVLDFLRKSNIRVTIETDVESHIDRAVELIKRTNQLNYTKKQLPDDAEQARQTLLADLSPFQRQAGLVHVVDDYGDYGFVGFYMMEALHGFAAVVHFCFSCRTLGMGIERWVYAEIGRPNLRVVGEIVSDIFDNTPIDWINNGGFAGKGAEGNAAPVSGLRFRGGCEFDAVTHYFRAHAADMRIETNIERIGMFIRADCSSNLMLTADGVLERWPGLFEDLGLPDDNLLSRCLDAPSASSTLVLATWGDAHFPHYVDRETGVRIGFMFKMYDRDLTKMTDEAFEHYAAASKLDEAAKAKLDQCRKTLASRYRSTLGLPLNEVERNMKAVVRRFRPGRVIIVLPSVRRREPQGIATVNQVRAYNQTVRSAVGSLDGVRLIELDDCIQREDEILPYWLHYHRTVYFRLYRQILSLATAPPLAEDVERAAT